MEAEQRLLGRLMCGDAVTAMAKISQLSEEHFEHPTHAKIFTAIKKKASEGIEPNPVVVSAYLPQNLFDEHGGSKYLAELAGMASFPWPIADLARTIIELYTRRKIIEKVTDYVKGEIMDSGDAITDIVSSLQDLQERSMGYALKNFQQMAHEIVADMEKEPRIDSTGLKALNLSMDGGLHGRRSYYVAGESGVGKTVLLGTVSYNLNQAGVPHLFIAAEMGAKQIHERQMARRMACNSSAFIYSRKQPEFIEKAMNSALYEKEAGLYLDAPGISFDRLKSTLSYAVSKHGIRGVILDYIQLVTGRKKGESEASFIGEVAQWIASFCGANNIWLLSVAQLNRDGDILGSGGIKRAADQIYHIKKNEYGGAWLVCDKSRYTPLTDVGSESYPAFRLNKLGAFFEEV